MAKKDEAQPRSKRVSWMIWGLLAGCSCCLPQPLQGLAQTNQALKAELSALQPVATEAVMRQEALQTRVAYVQSDEYVRRGHRRCGMTPFR